MNVRVLLFALAKQRAGRDVIEIELPPGATVRQLREALAQKAQPLADLLPHVRFAVNSEYAADRAVIPAGAEVALIPPVSGG